MDLPISFILGDIKLFCEIKKKKKKHPNWVISSVEGRPNLWDRLLGRPAHVAAVGCSPVYIVSFTSELCGSAVQVLSRGDLLGSSAFRITVYEGNKSEVLHVLLTVSVLAFMYMWKIHTKPKHGFKGGEHVWIRSLLSQIVETLRRLHGSVR